MSQTSNTHLQINSSLCGELVELEQGAATVRLQTTEVMVADDRGLVHGGFVFGLVDYAAMLAVNDPYVVLGSAEVRFTAPVKLGEIVIAQAKLVEEKGKKRVLEVSAQVEGREVFAGKMTAFVLEEHVLGAQAPA